MAFKAIWRDHILVCNNKFGFMKDCMALNGSGCDSDLQNSLYLQSGNSYLSVSIGRQIWQPSHSTVIWGEKGWIWTLQNCYWLPNQKDFTSHTYGCLSRRKAAIMCVPSVLVIGVFPVSSQNYLIQLLAHTIFKRNDGGNKFADLKVVNWKQGSTVVSFITVIQTKYSFL